MSLIKKEFDSLKLNEFGTENMSIVLYSLIRFTRPHRILELGMGHSTMFLAHALKDIKEQIDYQNSNFVLNSLNNPEYSNIKYKPIIDVIDNFAEEEFLNYSHYKEVLEKNNMSSYVNIINDNFFNYIQKVKEPYDFMWIDGGGQEEYYYIINVLYPKMSPGSIIVFHNTISHVYGKLFETNLKLALAKNQISDLEIISFKEPHKHDQNNFTICKKSYL